MSRSHSVQSLASEFGDSAYPSQIRRRPRDFAEDLGQVIVRPTIVITTVAHDFGAARARHVATSHTTCRGERQAEAAPSLHAAKLRLLLEEPLTRLLGSMQAPVVLDCARKDSQQLTEPRLRRMSGPSAVDLPLAAAAVSEPEALTLPALPHSRRPTHAAPARGNRLHARASEAQTGAQPLAARSRDAPPKARKPASPAAPHRSTLPSGIVDGWERAPNANRARGQSQTGGAAPAAWLWLTGAGASSMLLAYVLTSLLLSPPAATTTREPLRSSHCNEQSRR